MTIPATCELCGQLADLETSFYKYGWPEMDRPLPAAAHQLLPVGPVTDYDTQRHHIRRCPLCGTMFQYDLIDEYYVNGSEEEERLTRLY